MNVELPEEYKSEIQKLIKESLLCNGVCNWKSGEWQEHLNEELAEMIQQHIVKIRHDIVTDVMPKFSQQVMESQVTILEHFSSSLGESRKSFNLSIDDAVKRISETERIGRDDMEVIVAERIHAIVNGNFDRVMKKLDETSNKMDENESWKEELKGKSVPDYFKYVFSTHPFRFTAAIILFTAVFIDIIARLLQTPITEAERFILDVLQIIF
jgi:hypothetical protein